MLYETLAQDTSSLQDYDDVLQICAIYHVMLCILWYHEYIALTMKRMKTAMWLLPSLFTGWRQQCDYCHHYLQDEDSNVIIAITIYRTLLLILLRFHRRNSDPKGPFSPWPLYMTKHWEKSYIPNPRWICWVSIGSILIPEKLSGIDAFPIHTQQIPRE